MRFKEMTRSALTSARFASLVLAVSVCMFAPWSALARPVRVYDVTVTDRSQPALQEAMRQALVRATGHREAASDPALASIVESAQTYVKGYTKGAQGQTQVSFDGPALERALAAAGRGVWSADRPFTFVSLYPVPARDAAESVREQLEQAAARRGLSISLVPIPVVDASGRDVAPDALLAAAQRAGAEALLVGRSDGAGSQYRWTLYTSLSSPTWSGTLTAGIDGAVETLAPPLNAQVAQGSEGDTRVEVHGVNGLADFASVERLLQGIPGVRHARLAEAQGTQATFDLAMRGGAEALDRALAASPRLARAPGAAGGSLVYQYHP
jgi:hypothetical protein